MACIMLRAFNGSVIFLNFCRLRSTDMTVCALAKPLVIRKKHNIFTVFLEPDVSSFKLNALQDLFLFLCWVVYSRLRIIINQDR